MPNFDDLFTSQPAQRENVPFDKDVWAAQKQAERDSVYAMVKDYATAMGERGELFQTYLDVQARFDRYSVSNAILIAQQMPEATKLADFDSWKASGAYVRRGADAIVILEPGKEYERGDGSVGVSYNVKKVFDVSQTNSHRRTMPAVSRDERLLLKALIGNAPCTIQITESLPERVNAAYQAEADTIYLRQGLDAPAIFRALSLEIARATIDKDGFACENPDFTAYSVAYMLCKRNQISVDGFSFSRMPEQYGQMDERAFRDEVSVIREVANTLSDDMNRVFEALQHNPKHRDDGAR